MLFINFWSLISNKFIIRTSEKNVLIIKREKVYLRFIFSYYTKDQKFYLEYNMTCFFAFFFCFWIHYNMSGFNWYLLIIVIIIMLNKKYKIKEDLIATLLGFSHFCFCLESILQWWSMKYFLYFRIFLCFG